MALAAQLHPLTPRTNSFGEGEIITHVPLSLRAINAELARQGYDALLGKGGRYFYFWGGEAADWLDQIVRVQTLQSLTLDQWMEEFLKLREINHGLMGKETRTDEKRPTPLKKLRHMSKARAAKGWRRRQPP